MTTYSAVASTEIDADSPITDALLSKLANNPTAITEGASGAPRIQFAAMDAWFSTPGAVGSFVFGRSAAGAASFGGTVAGSNLRPTSAVSSNASTSGAMNSAFDQGSTLAGTWQCLGAFTGARNAGGGGSYLDATLWQRIA